MNITNLIMFPCLIVQYRHNCSIEADYLDNSQRSNTAGERVYPDSRAHAHIVAYLRTTIVPYAQNVLIHL